MSRNDRTILRVAAKMICFGFLTGLPVAAPMQNFVQMTNTGIPGVEFTTAAFGDYNNDGFIDLAATEGTTRLIVYKNTPSDPGRFTETMRYDEPERQLAWADFDNDGDLDLFANKGGGSYTWLFQNSGAPNYTLALVGGQGGVLAPAYNAQGAGWFDFNRDGWIDLFNSSGGAQSKLYRNKFVNGQPYTTWFADYNSGSATASGSQWVTQYFNDGTNTMQAGAGDNSPNGSYSVTADINNDGRQDILYAVDQTGSNQQRLFVWLNQTAKDATQPVFYEIGKLVLSEPYAASITSDINWSGVVSWDADNDGDLDVLFSNCNGYSQQFVRDQFYENKFGYAGLTPFSTAGFADKLEINKLVPFGDNNGKRSGGVAAGDLDNNGWLDLYVVQYAAEDHLYLHTGTAGLNGSTYTTYTGPNSSGNANGVTFGDIDNDGDLDMFLCNGGKVFYNTTNDNYRDGKLHPAHPSEPDFWPPSGSGTQEHYLDVMVSGASVEDLISTKDGVGSRVYLYRMNAGDPSDPAIFDQSRLIGLREIDGGSGYGSQATQVQHFGLDENALGPNPQLLQYAAKAVFSTGDTLWKFGIIPENVEVKIVCDRDADGVRDDTTYLAQTIEMSLLEVWLDPISRIDIEAVPASAQIEAGDSVFFRGTVWTLDRDGHETKNDYYSGLIRWEWTPITAGTTAGRAGITNTIDSTTKFWSTEAFTQYRVKAWLQNPQDPTDVDSAFMTVTVVAGQAHHISIERSAAQPASHANLVNDNPWGTVVFTSVQASKTVYAIQRDRYGNWAGPADTPTWSSDNLSIATAVPGAVPSNGEGKINRVAASGSTVASAAKTGLLPGSVTVTLQATTYIKLRIVNAVRDSLASLTMSTDADTVLFAEGQNSATHEWEPVAVVWSVSAGLSLDPAHTPPSNVNNWAVYPGNSSSGTIQINLGTTWASIPATFTKGAPKQMFLYRLAGAPDISGNDSLVSSIRYDLTAGQPFTVYSKLFDANHEWLDTYQNDPALAARITWQVIDDAGVSRPTYLNRTAGSSIIFTPTRAHHVYRVTASFNTGTGTILTATVQISVNAASPAQLFIENTYQRANSPNDPDPWSPIEIGKNSTLEYAYAVLRDQYGNWYGPSPATAWSSADTIIIASNGAAAWGQGSIERNANAGTTTLQATDNGTGYTAAAEVILRDITYDSLRIVVTYGAGTRDIDSLIMRTDQDTTLLALGMRSDDSTWEAVSVQWSSSGISFTPSAPSATSWRLSPNQLGSGTIAISLGGQTDLIGVRAAAGQANSIGIYDFAGDPVGKPPYPDTLFTVAAGDTMALYGKIFDHNNVWLGAFEQVDSLRARISWADNGSQGGVFTLRDGNRARFVPTKAQALVTITASYEGPDTTFSDQIVFKIIPGAPSQLVIEATAEGDPNVPQPFGTITITGTDTTRYAYAILRDRFGNFVKPSNPTTWRSLNPAIATAATRQSITGEGVIRRGESRDGSTPVIARDDSTGLRDTVDIIVKPYKILALRIVVDAPNDSGFAAIATLTMRTDQDTTLRVLGQRSDTKQWIPVAADWSAQSSGGGSIAISPAAGRAEAWTDLSPIDPDTGVIAAALGEQTVSINVYFAAGLPDHVVLYPTEGEPGAGQQYGTQISAPAGTALPLVAKVFDTDDHWLATYESGSAATEALFGWQTLTLNETVDSSTGTVSGTGHAIAYTPTVAFRNVIVRVTLTPAGQTRGFTDEIKVQTVAGPPHHIVLEANAEPSNRIDDDPVDTLTITADERAGYLYAILRDAYGNYVGNSQNTSWASEQVSIVTVAAGFQINGEGVATRVGNGLTTVSATNLTVAGLAVNTDKAYVRVVNYYYERLRIMIGKTIPDDLTMSTNDDTTVHVQGLRSDTVGVWEDVAGVWELSEPLVTSPGPSKTVSWRFSPTAHGTGWIRVFLDNDRTVPDTLPVVFTIGAPLRTSITILTPTDSLVAGEPISAEVRIYNRDGLVPLQTCYEDNAAASYRDALPDGDRQDPSVVTDQDSTKLNTNGRRSTTTDQCFNNGVDTVTLRLYYAPFDPDSLHNITVRLGGIEASTGGFQLQPSALDSLAIRSGGTYLPDDTTLVLRSPDGVVVLYSIGFDRFGNLRGEEIVDWDISGTLYDPGNTIPRSRMYYDASNAQDSQDGFISAHGTNGVSDSVAVKVLGPAIAVEWATMRDFNGDGYIDAVQFHFHKPVQMNDSLLDFIAITTNEYSWEIDSFAGADSSFDTDFTLYLKQIVTEDAQTDWKIDIAFDQDFEGVDAVTLPVADGAGPVIWHIIKSMQTSGDRSQDRVTIIFSEPVIELSGADLEIGISPYELFEVFEFVPATGTYVRLDNMLKGITELTSVSGDTAVTFVMSNANDLLSRHFIRIDATSKLITDKSVGNEPLIDNQKVRVIVVGTPPESVISYPNPAKPDFKFVAAGEFTAEHNPGARQYVKNGGQGTVLTFKLSLPSRASSGSTGSGIPGIRVLVKVYDIAGNLVQMADNPNILESLERGYGSDFNDASVLDVDLYWNGSNKMGMPVAPGLYRAIVYIDYEDGTNDSRIPFAIGIAR